MDVRASTIGLEFELDPKSNAFTGIGWYALELSGRKRVLELHAADLKVSRVTASFRNAQGDTVTLPARVEVREVTQTIRLCFDRLLPGGAVRVELQFRGRVRTDLRGLYRGAAAPDSRESWIATQLCPTDARRFFPCLDEPGMKSRYSVRVIAPADQTVIGNAPIAVEKSLSDGRKQVDFETTPPLSSYLVALAVGPFEAASTAQVGSTPIRVYALPGQKRLAAFAAEAACESLARLEVWFDTKHPYAKLDLVALPDFAFGAMENAGAVFFRDSILLVDPDEAKSQDLKRTGEVVAHELSHMWFGNWVTMAWWNDLWLNEAFATWMAYEIVHDWQPDWQIWLDFAHRRSEALREDALAHSHPIAPPIRSAEEAQENFDAITYTKGACVLRMLERYIGAETFQEGIRLYIRRHQEANATASDLWDAMGHVSEEPIEKIVSPWITQTGFPVLRASRPDDSDSREILLEQSRFLALPKESPPAPGEKWAIPWIGRRLGAKRPTPPARQLLTRKRERIEATQLLAGPFYPNAEEAAFLRIEAEPALRHDVLQNLIHLSAIERIGWIDNTEALVHLNRIPLSEFIELLAALGDEVEAEVLTTIESTLTKLAQRLLRDASPTASQRFRTFLVETFSDRLELDRVDAVEDLTTDRAAAAHARRLAIVAGLGQEARLVRHCEDRARAYLLDHTPIEPTLISEILGIGARSGDRALHESLRQATLAAKTPQERRCTFFALASMRDPALLELSFAAALDARLAPAPDRAGLLALLLASADSAPLIWTMLKENFHTLEKGLPPIVLARLVGATSAALAPEEAAGIRAFFRKHPLDAGSRVIDQVCEELTIAKRFEATALPQFEAIFGS